MKKILYIPLLSIIIGGILFIRFFMMEKNINIEQIKNQIVIIIPETDLVNYKNNPVGLFENYKESGIGAGFFIDNYGTIQTVNHLIENNNINYKILYNKKEYNSIVIYRNKEKDLATLKIILKENALSPSTIEKSKKQKSYINNIFKIKSKSKKNNDIYSFGVDIKKLEIIYNTGIILDKKSKLNNMPNLLEISNTIEPGFSGGPVINSKGIVIGINYAISNGKKYAISLY